MSLTTRQLNRMHDYGTVKENQLRVFERLGAISGPLPKPAGGLEAFPVWQVQAAPVATLARSFPDANCVRCHGPGGRGHTGGAVMDMRFRVPPAEAFVGKKAWLSPGGRYS